MIPTLFLLFGGLGCSTVDVGPAQAASSDPALVYTWLDDALLEVPVRIEHGEDRLARDAFQRAHEHFDRELEPLLAPHLSPRERTTLEFRFAHVAQAVETGDPTATTQVEALRELLSGASAPLWPPPPVEALPPSEALPSTEALPPADPSAPPPGEPQIQD